MTLKFVKTHFRKQKSYHEAMLEEEPAGTITLYIRRDLFPDNTYEEYAYIGPEEEVCALAQRAKDVDLQKVDVLLRQGKSFDEALKELGA